MHVLVAERHRAVRRALRAAIAGPFVYHEAALARFLSKTIELTPDVVVLDAALPVFENPNSHTTGASRQRPEDRHCRCLRVGVELSRRFRDAGVTGMC